MVIYFHILKFEILPHKMGPYGMNVFWTHPNSIYFSVSKLYFVFQNRPIWDAHLYPPPPLSSRNNSRKGDLHLLIRVLGQTKIPTKTNIWSQNFPALCADAENGPIWDQLFILKVDPYGMHKFKVGAIWDA